ncbi:MAG TPA: gliding motility-associated C-terminal domain-containing protein, partial [Bacteroidales bacterium]|nr:gliding motility-associated C-terminal domain-containing protein [Bacteroidales bacterium]
PRATTINSVPEMCYGQAINITLNSPTVMTKGPIRFDYFSNVTDPGLVGTLPAAADQPMGQKFTFTYQNNTDTIQSVNYYITPDNLLCGTGPQQTVEVKVHPHPMQSMGPTRMFTCFGGSSGTLTAILARGSKPMTIFWDRPSFLGDTTYLNSTNIDTLNIRYSGEYSVKVTDSFGCTRTSHIEPITGVVFQTLMTVYDYPTGLNTQCPGDSTGSMLIAEDIFSTGIAPFEYWLVYNNLDTVSHDTLWVKGDIYYINNLPAGHYALRLKDANGCMNAGYYPQRDITPPDTIKVKFNSTKYAGGFDVSCRGYSDGKVWVETITGGNPGGYRYKWFTYDGTFTGVDTLDFLENVSAGKYYLMVTDRYCTHLDSVTLYQGPGMDIADYKMHFTADSLYNISCHGGNDGSIDITITGGSGNYTYSWTDSASFASTSQDITGLRAGTYYVEVKDENNCILKILPGSLTPSFTLNEPDPIDISPLLSNSTFGPYNINCHGSTGTIGISVAGGSGSYTYSWITTDGSGIVSGQANQGALTAGNYLLEVTDMYGCKATFDTLLTEAPSLATSIQPKHITCAAPGMNNGEADLAVTGGVAPYTYMWLPNGEITEDITGLTAGEYFVTVTDANGCTIEDSVTINLPAPVDFSYILSNHNGYGFNISCFGRNDGSISISTTSGTGPFLYSWTGPSGFTSNSNVISNLIAGSYNLHIVDANFCTNDTTFILTEPGELSLTLDPSDSFSGGFNINCAGDSTGSINVIPVNAVGDLSYLWSDGNTSQMRENIPAGKYKVIITDSNFCIARDSVTLTEPDSLRLSFALTQPWCPDKPDGAINLTVSGGVVGTDYNYRWSDNSTAGDLTDIRSGLYSVKVTDLNGCSVRDSVKLESQREVCLIIPNAISPNGDNINDIWNIGEIELYPQLEIKIFDRWGILIWKSEKGYPQKWDGRSSRGAKLPMESYHYIIDLHNGTKPLIGSITIVR